MRNAAQVDPIVTSYLQLAYVCIVENGVLEAVAWALLPPNLICHGMVRTPWLYCIQTHTHLSQCMGRALRAKTDYGILLFADKVENLMEMVSNLFAVMLVNL